MNVNPYPAAEQGIPPAPPAVAGRVGSGLPAIGSLAVLMRLLSEPVRLRVLCELAGGERNVTQLCAALGLPQPTISHHLGLMSAAGLLSRRRDGKMIYYGLGVRTRAADGGLEAEAGGYRVLITCR